MNWVQFGLIMGACALVYGIGIGMGIAVCLASRRGKEKAGERDDQEARP